ncbi:MAG TPA: GNAT family N-acetyltransferase [Bacillus bacterium]|nr:GNAT family N-acetyltransferase [Bacillus sp. (in: firmicutes)]
MFREIRDITSSNKKEILLLNIAEEQRGFIESIPQCLKEAREDYRFVPVGLYENGTAVGFAMYGKFEEQVWLDRFLIDERFQGKGLGKYFLQEIILFLEEKFTGHDIYLTVFKDNTRAIQLYKRFGFFFTGEKYKRNEEIMRKKVDIGGSPPITL